MSISQEEFTHPKYQSVSPALGWHAARSRVGAKVA